MKSLGVALGGGGLRGLAHIGVLQILEDNNVKISMLSGTSIGSIISSLYASGISAYQMEELVMRLKPSDYLDYNLGGLLKNIASILIPGYEAHLSGMIKGRKLENLLSKLTKEKSLMDIRLPLSLISCDINTGKEVVFSNSKKLMKNREIFVINNALLSEAARCSSSIPATFVPRKINGMQMVDGGVRTMVPVRVQELMGADYILAVNLGQKEYTSKVYGIPEIISRTINILTLETSDTEEKIFADMLIFPDVKDVSLNDLEKASEIIRKGRLAMKRKVNDLKSELNK